MKMHVYCFFDKKAGVYYSPSFEPYDIDDKKEVCRRVALTGNIPNLDDLEVYSLGIFDDKTGMFNCSKPEFVMYMGGIAQNA